MNRPKHVQLVGQPGATPSAFWPTSVYPRIESRSQRVSVRRWIALLVVLDAVIATLAVAVATLAIFGASPEKLNDRLPYAAIAATFPALWVAAMLLSGSYARRYLAAGPEQYRRVCNASIWILALIGFTSYVLRADFSRGLVLITIPLAALLTLLGRWVARKALRRRFGDGVAIHRIVEVGPGKGAEQLRNYIDRNTHTGFSVVGVVATDALPEDEPIDVDEIVNEVRRLDADTIAFVGTTHSTGGEFVVCRGRSRGRASDCWWSRILPTSQAPASSCTRSTNSHCSRSVEPESSGPARIVKSVFDRVASLFLISS